MFWDIKENLWLIINDRRFMIHLRYLKYYLQNHRNIYIN